MEQKIGNEMSYDELYDKYIRLLADFENYKKASRKNLTNAVETAENNVILKLLPVIDVLTIALKYESDDLKNLYKELINTLSSMGVEKFGEIGDKFDDEKHNAVYITNSVLNDDNTVSGILKYGYKYKGKIIRYADVAVNRRQ